MAEPPVAAEAGVTSRLFSVVIGPARLHSAFGSNMILGIVFCVMGLIHGVFKYFVIRSAARDVYNGGGVPVMDFAVFVPLWLSIGATLVLKHLQHYPFPLCGVVVYFILAITLYGLMQVEYRLGKPERLRQLEAIRAKGRAEHGAPPNGGPAEPLGNSGVSSGPPSMS